MWDSLEVRSASGVQGGSHSGDQDLNDQVIHSQGSSPYNDQHAYSVSSIPFSNNDDISSVLSDNGRGTSPVTQASDDPHPLSHGFSFGEKCISFQPTVVTPPEASLDKDHEDIDEGISEVYGHDGTDRYVYTSPTTNKRQVISQRIGKVGHIGHNLGLGHRLGIMMEDTELRPRPIRPGNSEFVIRADSPLQTDITWDPPKNAHAFASLSYNIEMCHASVPDEQWSTVSSVKHSVLRIYHTDDKLFIGKKRILREDSNVSFFLRIQVLGEIIQRGAKHVLASDWCESISVTFCGYRADTNVIESTSL